MTQLREQMIDAMTVRGFSPRTHQSYLMAVKDLARYHQRPPDQLSEDELQAYCNRSVNPSFQVRSLL